MKTTLLVLAAALVGFCFGQSSEPYTAVKVGDFVIGYVFPKLKVTADGKGSAVFVLDEEVANAIEGQCKVKGENIVCDHGQYLQYYKTLVSPGRKSW